MNPIDGFSVFVIYLVFNSQLAKRYNLCFKEFYCSE